MSVAGRTAEHKQRACDVCAALAPSALKRQKPCSLRRDSDIRNAGHHSGKLDRVAQHAAPMQPSQPAHGIGIACISVTDPGVHLPQKPAARRGRESRDQANDDG